jgi:hypothetical protein
MRRFSGSVKRNRRAASVDDRRNRYAALGRPGQRNRYATEQICRAPVGDAEQICRTHVARRRPHPTPYASRGERAMRSGGGNEGTDAPLSSEPPAAPGLPGR